MKYATVLFLFFVSCAKREQEDPLMFLQDSIYDSRNFTEENIISEQTKSQGEIKKETISETSAEIEKQEEIVAIMTLEKELNAEDKEILQKTFNLSDSTKEIKVSKDVSVKTEPIKKAESKSQNKPQNRPQKEQVTKIFVFDDKYYPITREDAKNYAFECYKKAKSMSNIDSVRIVSQKGLSMYENSSLYYLYAKGLTSVGNYTLAANNCKTALSRDDFWGEEKNEAIKLLVECLQKTYEKTPSEMLLSQISKYKEMVK